jgi:glyoxylase-like metal-dependent hydrolase (beta-lactamase superfamily II)
LAQHALHRPSASPDWDATARTTEPADGIFLVEGPASNWIIVRDATGYLLIDGGYPADTPLVLASLQHLGLDPADAAAMLITHGHVDHTGSAAYFAKTFNTPILCSAAELAHVQGLEKHQVSFGQVLPRIWRPRVLRWMLHAIAAGALKAEPARDARAWTEAELQSLPGGPVPVLSSAHTPGHTSYLLPAASALVTGDLLVTGHPISPVLGPQLLDPIFHLHPGQAVASLDVLSGIDATVILPGHGSALRSAPAAAAAAATLSR